MVKIGLDVPHGSNTFPPSKGIYKDGVAYHEHDFGSIVATKAKSRLEALGFEVVMPQKPFSPEVPLSQRTSYYKKQGVDFVWSFHANANSNKDIDGRCVFYWYSDDKAKKAAEIYVEELKKAGYDTHGNGLHASLPTGWTNLHICRVNAQNGIPAILTENGFMSNDQPGIDDDFELIFGSKQDEYTTVIAEIGIKTICRLFGVDYREEKVKTASTAESNKEEENILTQPLEPSIHALNKAVQSVLYRWEKEEGLSDQWRKKFERRELTESDAIALLFVGVDRGYDL